MELSPSWEAANCAATQELPSIYGTRRFITVFKRALHWCLSWAKSIHWCLSWARSIQSAPPHPIPSSSILIFSTHLRLGLLSGLFPSGFPTNILYAFSSPHSYYIPCPSNPHWLDHSNYTRRRVQVMKLLIMQFNQSAIRVEISMLSVMEMTGFYCRLHGEYKGYQRIK
jgi:hypothetical protein